MTERMNRILMIAYHFPPLAGSSGIQRTLRFVQHLPALGWQPIVLTAHPMAYERTSPDLEHDIPAEAIIKRSLAFDTARHLAIRGRYLKAMALPDRWKTWKYAGIRDGMKLIEKYRPQIIWSTYPIATAHVIAAELHARSGLPWVADFRDPMAQEGYPTDPLIWRQFKLIEEQAMDQAQLATFTTPGAARLYQNRYPAALAQIEVLENGYDEETFAQAEAELADCKPINPGCLTLLHSGIVYPSERDPTALFAALSQLKEANATAAARLKLRFRAAVHDELLHKLAKAYNVADSVEILPAIPYREALAEMLRADGLLLLQAANCNDQVPAKVYEYLRAHRPILAFTDPSGDTASTLTASGVKAIAPLDQSAGIVNVLMKFLENPSSNTMPTEAAIAGSSREGRAKQFASLLNSVLRSSSNTT